MSNLSVKTTVFCFFFCRFLDIPQILHVYASTVVSHIYAYDRAKTLSFILFIRRKSTEFKNESNV